MTLQTRKSKSGKYSVVTVDGEIESEAVRGFADLLLGSVDRKNAWLAVDLSNCEFVSSTGLGAIAAALMVCRARGGDLKIVAPTKNVLRLLEMTRLDDIIEIMPTAPKE